MELKNRFESTIITGSNTFSGAREFIWERSMRAFPPGGAGYFSSDGEDVFFQLGFLRRVSDLSGDFELILQIPEGFLVFPARALVDFFRRKTDVTSYFIFRPFDTGRGFFINYGPEICLELKHRNFVARIPEQLNDVAKTL